MNASARAVTTLAVALVGLMAVLCGSSSTPRNPLNPANVENFEPRGYVCGRAANPPIVDGRINDAVWQTCPWSDDFVDIEGDRKPRPRFRTRMKMCWDDAALYIAVEMEEPHVWGTLTQHDSVIFKDNDFEVFLDPDADSHLYAELELNALNTTWDLLLSKPYKDSGHAIDSWEMTGLRTAVHVDGTIDDPRDRDRGWTVEIAWPWQSIKEIAKCKVPPRDGDQWRINFSRVEWEHIIAGGKYQKVDGKPEDNWVWSPQGVVDMHRPERWGILQFSSAAPGIAALTPDHSLPARYLLHRVYYAQRDYKKRHQKWAPSLRELGLEELCDSVRMNTTPNWFDVETRLRIPNARLQRWHIAADSRVWHD